MDITCLRPFSGLHSSLITFSSGHAFRISLWSATPTEFGPFSNLWMVTPDDRRVLFADPLESGPVVCNYHNFDGVVGAHIRFERPEPLRLHLVGLADNGTRVEMSMVLVRTRGLRLLTALSKGLPAKQASKDPMLWLSELATAALMPGGGMRVAGHTDTGQPFFGADTEDRLLISECMAALDGASLGNLSPLDRPVAFGDFKAGSRAYLSSGRLYLAYEGHAGPGRKA